MVTFAENRVLTGGGSYNADAETQNYYVRNRYYLPTLGRWLTRDPIGYQGGINLYAYVQSSPVGNVDAAGLAKLGQRRIVGNTFALRPTTRHSSPGLIHTEQRAVADMGAITAIAGLPEALSDLAEGTDDVEACFEAMASKDEGAMADANREFSSFLSKYETTKILDSMSESINDLMKSDLRGAWNLNKDARNTGWAVWVRVKYQQYQDVSVWSPSFPILWRHCEKPQWVTHHQWVRVPNWSHQTTGYLDSPAGSYTIAWQLPHMYYYADQKVLRGGTQ